MKYGPSTEVPDSLAAATKEALATGPVEVAFLLEEAAKIGKWDGAERRSSERRAT